MILDLALCLTSTPTLCIVRAVLRSAVCFPTDTHTHTRVTRVPSRSKWSLRRSTGSGESCGPDRSADAGLQHTRQSMDPPTDTLASPTWSNYHASSHHRHHHRLREGMIRVVAHDELFENMKPSTAS